MLGWLLRFLMVLAGFIASFFVGKDELQFQTAQLAIAVILFTFFVAIMAFWPSIKKRFKGKDKN